MAGYKLNRYETGIVLDGSKPEEMRKTIRRLEAKQKSKLNAQSIKDEAAILYHDMSLCALCA